MEFFWPERAAALEPRPDFRAAIGRLRILAAGEGRGGYAASTGPLGNREFSDIEALAQTAHVVNGRSVWYRHVSDYVTGCKQAARQFLGSDALARSVHELVRTTGYALKLPALKVPTVGGPQASKAAAYFSGASWGSGEQANLRAWHRYRKSAVEPFVVMLDPFAVG